VLILSLDGGGVRGIASAVLLRRLEEQVPGWLDHVGLFAGSSTGAIIALGLAYGKTTEEIIKFYRDKLPEVFKQSWWRRYATLYRSRYSNAGLKKALNEVFGDETLGSLQRDVLIATYYLGQREPFQCARARFYDRSDASVRIADVALWSGSAPVYFPSADNHIDGGVAANNCTVCAMALAESRLVALSSLKVLSIGTGHYPTVVEGGDCGLIYWGQNILGPLIDGGSEVAEYQAYQFLREEGTYHRCQPDLSEDIPLDAVERIDDLVAIAEAVDLTNTVDWLSAQVGPATS